MSLDAALDAALPLGPAFTFKASVTRPLAIAPLITWLPRLHAKAWLQRRLHGADRALVAKASEVNGSCRIGHHRRRRLGLSRRRLDQPRRRCPDRR